MSHTLPRLVQLAPLLAERRARVVTPAVDFEPSAPAILLSPHADDAVLSCWSVLEPAGPAASVVTVCTGLPPTGTAGAWDVMTGAGDSRTRMNERLAENRALLEAIGAQRRDLGFLDLQYRGPRDTLDPSDVLHALAGEYPTMGTVYAPLGIGGHPDHLVARDVALELARRGAHVELYADMPYAVEWGWPAWVLEAAGDSSACSRLDAAAYWQQILDALRWDSERLRPRVAALSPDAAERKLEAIKRYRTQFEGLDAAPHDRVSKPIWRRYEVFWEIQR